MQNIKAKKIDKILRLPEILKLTGLSASTILRYEKKGTFPKRRKIGARIICWLQSDIENWLKNIGTK